MFWNACIETSGSRRRMGAGTPCLVPFFHSVLQVQAQKPCMHCFSFNPQRIPNSGVLGGLRYRHLGRVSSFGGMSVLWSSSSIPHASLEPFEAFSFLLTSHYAESCPPLHFMPPPFHHLWDLASDSAPSSPRSPGLAPELQSIPGLD